MYQSLGSMQDLTVVYKNCRILFYFGIFGSLLLIGDLLVLFWDLKNGEFDSSGIDFCWDIRLSEFAR